MEPEQDGRELNAFRGWLLVFLIVHVPLAFYNMTTGVYAFASYLKIGTGAFFAVLSLALCLVLPAALFLLFKRKTAFRAVYAAYCVIAAANYLMAQGVTGVTVTFALLLTLPWLVYVFCSRRVKAVLTAGTVHRLPGAPTNFE